MDDLWQLFADQLHDRVSGPMKFRIVLQPIMATYFAIRSGLRDAKSGKDPYFWSLLIGRGHRFDIDQRRLGERREGSPARRRS